MNEKLTLSVEEAGKLLGVSRQVAYQLIHREDFPTLHIGRRILVPRIGRRILIPRKQLEAWMDRHVTGAEVDTDQAG